MGTLLHLLSLPFLYGVAFLPFRALYLLSDLMCFIVHRTIGYRREVVLTNLRNSFPGKSQAEIDNIAAGFYRWFCDLTLETLKMLTLTPDGIRERVGFSGIDILRNYAREERSIILVLGHYGNWEWAGARYAQEQGVPPLHVIYHPLTNARVDRTIHHMRTRHGIHLYPMREAGKLMIRDRDRLTATAFIADQTPSPSRAYWMTFLGQDTPVFQGTEALSKKLDQPVVYISISRPRRGYYHMHAETLVAEPSALPLGAITEAHTQRLEADIRNYPDLWLWTHRRWKHSRSKSQATT